MLDKNKKKLRQSVRDQDRQMEEQAAAIKRLPKLRIHLGTSSLRKRNHSEEKVMDRAKKIKAKRETITNDKTNEDDNLIGSILEPKIELKMIDEEEEENQETEVSRVSEQSQDKDAEIDQTNAKMEKISEEIDKTLKPLDKSFSDAAKTGATRSEPEEIRHECIGNALILLLKGMDAFCSVGLLVAMEREELELRKQHNNIRNVCMRKILRERDAYRARRPTEVTGRTREEYIRALLNDEDSEESLQYYRTRDASIKNNIRKFEGIWNLCRIDMQEAILKLSETEFIVMFRELPEAYDDYYATKPKGMARLGVVHRATIAKMLEIIKYWPVRSREQHGITGFSNRVPRTKILGAEEFVFQKKIERDSYEIIIRKKS